MEHCLQGSETHKERPREKGKVFFGVSHRDDGCPDEESQAKPKENWKAEH